MNESLGKFNKARQDMELFSFWEEELALRHQLRQESVLSINPVITQTEEIDFLFRSLYFQGRQAIFFSCLLCNLSHTPAIQWLQTANKEVIESFFDFLAWFIPTKRPESTELRFLLIIFKESYTEAYQKLLANCTPENLEYLSARTANPALRQLIHNIRQDKLDQYRHSLYGAVEDNTYLEAATIFGNRPELFIETANCLYKASARNYADPYAVERFEQILKAAEMMFASALIDDSLLLLVNTQLDYQNKNRLVNIFDDAKLFKDFNRLARRIIPFYCLIHCPDPFAQANKIYREYFPQLTPDIYSLQYLKLHEDIKTGQKQRSTLLNLLTTAEAIARERSSDIVLIKENDLKEGFNFTRIKELTSALEERQLALPHESFIILELLTFFYASKLIAAQYCRTLLHYYLEFYQWLPAPLFFNEEIINILDNISLPGDRQKAGRILKAIQHLNSEPILEQLAKRPDIFRSPNEDIPRIMLIGNLMGVL